MIDLPTKRILVTGGNGFLGQNIVRVLRSQGCEDVVVPQSRYCDLRILENIRNLLDSKFDIVVHAAGQAGGIGLNQAKPAELFYNNLMMGAQLIHESYKANVEKFVQ